VFHCSVIKVLFVFVEFAVSSRRQRILLYSTVTDLSTAFLIFCSFRSNRKCLVRVANELYITAGTGFGQGKVAIFFTFVQYCYFCRYFMSFIITYYESRRTIPVRQGFHECIRRTDTIE
jgi:hypothetical protein